MTTSQNLSSPNLKILSPTLHLYYYVLRNSLNDAQEQLQHRRDYFSKNLYELAKYLTIDSGDNVADFLRLIPLEQDDSLTGNLLDFTIPEIPEECKQNSDRLDLQSGTITSRLAARRLNDTYLLRFTSYISDKEGSQSLKTFANLSKHLSNLKIELGKTAILAGILPQNEYQGQKTSIKIAAECLSYYCGQGQTPELIESHLIEASFLGSPCYFYPQKVTAKSFNGLSIQSIHLMGVILYQNAEVETKADKFYNILQAMLLSYHKIYFFYSQSRALKLLISHQYKEIEQLTEDYSNTKWNKESLKQLPHQSLEFYKKLSFLSDQEKTLRANLHNYRGCIPQIEKHIKGNLSGFLVDFVNDANYYLKQIQTTIGFMSPGLELYDKLMLAVQTQVSIDDERIQKQQSDQQQKLGQLLTGSCAAIAVGQILTPAITASVSHYYIDKDPSQPSSVTSLWVGGFLTIILSLLSGWLVSQLVYRWFTQPKSDETTLAKSVKKKGISINNRMTNDK